MMTKEVAIRSVEMKAEYEMTQFATCHPYVATVSMLVGIPVFLLGALFAATTAILLPMSMVMGWL